MNRETSRAEAIKVNTCAFVRGVESISLVTHYREEACDNRHPASMPWLKRVNDNLRRMIPIFSGTLVTTRAGQKILVADAA